MGPFFFCRSPSSSPLGQRLLPNNQFTTMIACAKFAQPSARCVSLLARSALRPLSSTVVVRQESSATTASIASYSGISSLHIASKPSVSSIVNQIRTIRQQVLDLGDTPLLVALDPELVLEQSLEVLSSAMP